MEASFVKVKDAQHRPARKEATITIEFLDRTNLQAAKAALTEAFKREPGVDKAAHAEIERFLDQEKKELTHRLALYDLDYFILKNKADGRVLGVVGLYTVETSAPGFYQEGSTNIVARLGWTGVPEAERKTGRGREIFELMISASKLRGADIFAVETSPTWTTMHKMCEKQGLKRSVNAEAYFAEGVNLRSLAINLKAANPPATTAAAIEAFDPGMLQGLEPLLAKGQQARLADVIQKAAYAHTTKNFESVIKATPILIRDGEEAIGFALLSEYGWLGEERGALWASLVVAKNGRETDVAAAVTQHAKGMGARMLVAELPELAKDLSQRMNEELGARFKVNPQLVDAFRGQGFTSEDDIAGLYPDGTAFIFYSMPVSRWHQPHPLLR